MAGSIEDLDNDRLGGVRTGFANLVVAGNRMTLSLPVDVSLAWVLVDPAGSVATIAVVP